MNASLHLYFNGKHCSVDVGILENIFFFKQKFLFSLNFWPQIKINKYINKFDCKENCIEKLLSSPNL